MFFNPQNLEIYSFRRDASLRGYRADLREARGGVGHRLGHDQVRLRGRGQPAVHRAQQGRGRQPPRHHQRRGALRGPRGLCAPALLQVAARQPERQTCCDCGEFAWLFIIQRHSGKSFVQTL